MYFSVRKNTKNGTHHIVIPKKVIPGAVQRNKAKRRIRHMLAEHSKTPIIVVVHKNITSLSYKEMVDCMKEKTQKPAIKKTFDS